MATNVHSEPAAPTAEAASLPPGRTSEHGFPGCPPLSPGFFLQAWCCPTFRCNHCGVWNYDFWPVPSYWHYGPSHVPFSRMENVPNRGNSESVFGETADSAPNHSATNLYEARDPESPAPGTHERSLDMCGFDEEQEDEEVEFILTDEWMEFFAKSEARRKERKIQRRKDEKAARKATKLISQHQEEL